MGFVPGIVDPNPPIEIPVVNVRVTPDAVAVAFWLNVKEVPELTADTVVPTRIPDPDTAHPTIIFVFDVVNVRDLDPDVIVPVDCDVIVSTDKLLLSRLVVTVTNVPVPNTPRVIKEFWTFIACVDDIGLFFDIKRDVTVDPPAAGFALV